MLPRLREELALFPGPRSIDGAPTWALHDPVRNVFFSIDWLTFEVLSRWGLDDPQAIVQAIAHETTIHPEDGDLEAVQRFLIDNELVQSFSAQGTARFLKQAASRKTGPGTWLLHSYLFFRIPLWRPDKWLTAAMPMVEPLFSRTFAWLTLAALMVGLIETSRQWETFMATLVDTFSLEGVAGFMVALVFAKIVHELGHAFTAKRYGCRVPTMGVAFLLLFPMAYTDVNEVWKIKDHRKRLAVGAAGIRTELVIAAWATLLWAMMPDGVVRNGVFILATTTWISTIVINASPFLRFDGYFILMDWLGMPNLHQRAFALGRWKLREALFAFGDPVPEALSTARHRGLIGFAYATWLYRLIVFGGIALIVYSVFPKPLGPFLAFIEVWWFIAKPVWKELREWRGDMDRITVSRRFRVVLLVVLLVGLVGVVPWDSRIHGQGVLRPVGTFSIIVPEAVRVVAMPVGDGQPVRKDDILFELESPDLDAQHQLKEVQAATATWQSAAAGVNEDLRTDIRLIEAARARLNAELTGVSAERSRHQIRARADGIVFHNDLDLQPGLWLGRNEHIATVLEDGAWHVVTYLTEGEISRISPGDTARFYSEQGGAASLALVVETIDRDATRILTDGLLASTRGGQTLVRETDKGLVPEAAVYRVVLAPAEGISIAEPRILRGAVVVSGARKSPLGDFARAAAAVVVREAGF